MSGNNKSLFVGMLFAVAVCVSVNGASFVSFDQNYNVIWGQNHAVSLNQGREMQLLMDNSSGGAGFQSKLGYKSGFFGMRLKLPGKDTAGVVTAFYLHSHTDNHDEVDFEFLGNREGQPITLQTNVFANGEGGREQRLRLWFDPAADFHTYQILWNPHHIVFYVDNIPIRVFKNNTKIGVKYPSKPMKIEVSLWNGENWATDGGKSKINWNHSPFRAHFQEFGINGCPFQDSSSSSSSGIQQRQDCQSSDLLWWNSDEFQDLNPTHQRIYQHVRKKYINYDYCTDKNRYPIPSPECPQ